MLFFPFNIIVAGIVAGISEEIMNVFEGNLIYFTIELIVQINRYYGMKKMSQ